MVYGHGQLSATPVPCLAKSDLLALWKAHPTYEAYDKGGLTVFRQTGH